MKKFLTVFCVFTFVVFYGIAASYDNNEYQVKSRSYSSKAETAFDNGEYDKAIEFSKLAEEYAQKSYDYIQSMLARTEAENAMNRARTRLTWAKENNAEDQYPDEMAVAGEAMNAGISAFNNENYDVAVVCANQVLDALKVVSGDESSFTTLPSTYRIRTWRGEKDCLWNIAKNPAVYNDPYKWRILYEANKDRLPDPNDPNWVEPGIVLIIPRINGEYRQGMYDPAGVYESLKSAQDSKSDKMTNDIEVKDETVDSHAPSVEFEIISDDVESESAGTEDTVEVLEDTELE